MIEAKSFANPYDLANHLSKYVTDPSALVAGTANHFGKSRAISLDVATRLVMKRRKERERAKKVAEHKNKDSDAFDHLPFKPAPLGRAREIAKQVVETGEAAPLVQTAKAGIWPAWYRPRPLRQLPRELIKAVGIDAGFSYQEMIGNGRSGEIVAARAVVCRVLRDRGLSYPQIGKFLGKRDHSTVINAVSKFEHYCQRYPGTLALYLRHRDTTDAS